MLGIGSDGLKGFRRGLEQYVVNHPLVLVRDCGDLLRYREDNMKVGNLEKLRLPLFDPLRSGQTLAFGTVAIATANGNSPLPALWGVFSDGEWGGRRAHCNTAACLFYSPLRLGLQESQQFVGRPELASAETRRYNRFDGFQLLGGISPNVDFGRG